MAVGAFYASDPDSREFGVKQVKCHGDYISVNANAIALLQLDDLDKLEVPMTWTERVRPLCLPAADPPVGSSCILTGWGGDIIFALLFSYNIVTSYKLFNEKNPMYFKSRCL